MKALFLITILLSTILVSSNIMNPKIALIFNDSHSNVMGAMEKLVEIAKKSRNKHSIHKTFYHLDDKGSLIVDGALTNLNSCKNILNLKGEEALEFCDLVKYLKVNDVCGVIYDESVGGIWMFKYKCKYIAEDLFIISKTYFQTMTSYLVKFGFKVPHQVDSNEFMILLTTDYN